MAERLRRAFVRTTVKRLQSGISNKLVGKPDWSRGTTGGGAFGAFGAYFDRIGNQKPRIPSATSESKRGHIMRRAYLFQLSAIFLLGCQPAFADSSAGLQASSQASSQESSQATSQESSQATSQQSSQATSQNDSQSSTQASTQAQPATPSNLTGDPLWSGGWRWNGGNTWSNGHNNEPSGNGGGGNGRQNYVGNNSSFHNQPNRQRFRAAESHGHLPERPGYKRFDNLGLGMPNMYVDARSDHMINRTGVTALAPNILMQAPRSSVRKRPYTLRYSNQMEYKRSHPQGAASRLAEHRNGVRI